MLYLSHLSIPMVKDQLPATIDALTTEEDVAV